MSIISHILVAAVGLSGSPYGSFYWLDQQATPSRSLRIGLGYGLNVSNDYVENHSILTSLEIFPSRYWSIGLLGQLASGNASASGNEIKNLETVDIQSRIYGLDGAVFATTGLDLLRGAWNFLDLGVVKSRLSLVGGYGWIHQQEITTKENQNVASYFWKAESAFGLGEPVEIYIAFLGHRAERYLSAGLQLSIGGSKNQPQTAN